MSNLNNPAGRLLALVNEGQRQDKQKRSVEIWPILLNTPADNMPRLLHRLAPVAALPRVLREKVASLPQNVMDRNLLLEWLGAVEGNFRFSNLDIPWASFIDPFLRPEVMYGLKVCSDQLARWLPDPILNEEDLENLRTDIAALRARIEQEIGDEDLKTYVLEQLEKILDSLSDYRVAGHKSVKQGFESAIGSAISQASLIERLKGWKEGKEYLSTLWKIYEVLAKADRAFRMLERVVTMLGWSGHGPIEISAECLEISPDPETGLRNQDIKI